MSKTHALIASALLSLANAAALASEHTTRPFAAADGPRSVFGERLELAVATEEVAAATTHDRIRIADFPLPDGYTVELDLVAFEPLADDALLLRVDADGPSRFAAPELRLYRGAVTGYPGSFVVLWVRDDHAGGSIRLAPDQSFRFGPRDPRFTSAAPSAHEVVRVTESVTDPEATGPGYCAGDSLAPIGSDGTTPPPFGVDSDERYRVTIAIDATVELHDHFGGVASTAAYIVSLFAEVAAIYERDLDVELALGFLRIFTAEPDPYTSGTASSLTLLAELRREWTSNPDLASVERASAHLLTHVPGMGGVAYVDVLCNSSYGYAASSIGGSYVDPEVGYSWDIDVVAHELGHNFGSGHTHCYEPEIDRCYNYQSGCYSGLVVPELGTIMSYCHLHRPGKSLVFHERVVEVIRGRLDVATCVEPVSAHVPGAIRVQDGGGLRLVKLGDGDRGELAVELSWSEPCNQFDIPGQDFAVYQGTLDRTFSDHRPLACSTGAATRFRAAVGPGESAYFVVVPQLDGAEGSYGGLPPSAAACAPVNLLSSCAP